MPEIETEFLFTIALEVDVFDLGDTPYGRRCLVQPPAESAERFSLWRWWPRGSCKLPLCSARRISYPPSYSHFCGLGGGDASSPRIPSHYSRLRSGFSGPSGRSAGQHWEGSERLPGETPHPSVGTIDFHPTTFRVKVVP
jgi:hypothetical protein